MEDTELGSHEAGCDMPGALKPFKMVPSFGPVTLGMFMTRETGQGTPLG